MNDKQFRECMEAGRDRALDFLSSIKPKATVAALRRQRIELEHELQGQCQDMGDEAEADAAWEGASEVLATWYETHKPGNQNVAGEYLAVQPEVK